MILTVVAVFIRLLIQWSLNRQQQKNERKSDGDEQNLDHNILEKIERKSCLDTFFFYATPMRLNIFFLVVYLLIYVVCAAVLLV